MHTTNVNVQKSRRHGLVWALVATAVSAVFYGGWQAGRFLYNVLKQPRLLTPLKVVPEHEKNFGKGIDIAAENLLAGLEKRPLTNGDEKLILCAGVRNFREPWARDFGFASYGLAALGLQEAVRDGLDAFFIFQKEDGHFPVKIHSTSVLERYLYSLFGREQPIFKPIRPKYITAHNTISLDGNCLLVIAALEYVRRFGDTPFLQTHWEQLKNAVHWLENHASHGDGLLDQAAFTDWADSVGRTGRILYTNVLYWKALHEMAEAAKMNGRSADAATYQQKANHLAQAIQTHFWREELGYFITSEEYTFLSSSGNLLAIAWGLATPEQANKILDKMDEFGMADPVPTQVTHLAYPKPVIAIENRLAGIPEYHTHAAWLWLGAWHVVALVKAGRLARAKELLERIDAVIARDGVVHEVYGKNGRFLSTFWYTSEAPLTWNAGMVVYAAHIYREAAGIQSPYHE